MNTYNKNHKKNSKSTSLMAKQQYPIKVCLNQFSTNDTPLHYLHWNKDMEFIIVTSGILHLSIEGRAFTIGEGELAFIHPHFIHSASMVNDTPCTFYSITIPPLFFEEYGSNEIYETYIHPLLSKRIIFHEVITHELSWCDEVFCLIHNIALMVVTAPKETELLIHGRIYELLYIFYQHSRYDVHSQKGRRRELKLSYVLDFIHDNYCEDLSLKQLADVIGISESQLCRLFKEELGISPFTYIIRHRILASCTLLHNTKEKISTIATSVGFSNISYYNREFKNIVGCTPSEYRKYSIITNPESDSSNS